jgi:hypothetical protein
VLKVGLQILLCVVSGNIAAGQFIAQLKTVQPGQLSRFAEAEAVLSVQSARQLDPQVARHIGRGHVKRLGEQLFGNLEGDAHILLLTIMSFAGKKYRPNPAKSQAGKNCV